MKAFIILCLSVCIPFIETIASESTITILTRNEEHILRVHNQNFFIKGMNWDYFPTGTNYNYSLWKQSDATIKAALDYEMRLLKNIDRKSVV